MNRFSQLRLTSLLLAVAFGILSQPLLGQVDRFTYTIDIPFDIYVTQTDFPCLTETIHVSGSIKEYFNSIVNPDSRIHWTLHQSADNSDKITAVGLTTGDRYSVSGPETLTLNGISDSAMPVEVTLVNKNHFIGPGPDANLYLRTVIHFTFDLATGQTKAEVVKDEVLCH